MRAAKRTAPWTHESVELRAERAGADARFRIAVVADTHGRPHPAAHELVAAAAPDAILHAGDIGDGPMIPDFERIAPTYAVRGNIDGHTRADSIAVRVCDSSGDPLLTLLLQHIAVYGPKLRADAVRNAATHGASTVVCGHSHVPFIGRDRGLIVFNPGSIGPRRFSLPITFGVITLADGKVELHHVSCESGERWTPQRPTRRP